jgi:hypothetical protein
VRVPDEAALRTAFTTRARRRLRRDNTLDLAGETFEVEQGFLAGRLVTVACCRLDQPLKPWVEHDSRIFKLHRVDPKANAKRGPRKTPVAPKRTVSFDPPGTDLAKTLHRTPQTDRSH